MSQLMEGVPSEYVPSQGFAIPSCDLGDELDVKAANGVALDATRRVVDKIHGFMAAVATAVPEEGARVVQHIDEQLLPVVTAINVALKAIAEVKSNIGDFEDLHDSQGHNSLSEAVSFIQDYPPTLGASDLLEFNRKIDEMYEALDKFRETVRDDIMDTGKFTLK